jgi:hypothetical protein
MLFLSGVFSARTTHKTLQKTAVTSRSPILLQNNLVCFNMRIVYTRGLDVLSSG